MALDNLPAFPDDMYDTAHDGAVPQPVTPRKPISPFSFTKHLTRTPVPVAVVPEDLPDSDLPLFTPQPPVGVVTAQALVDTCRSYLSNADVEKIREAYRYADNAHLGQFRKSGEPYITHPIAVASILASWRMDAETIEAGLMHDVLEDTGTSKREMAEKFGIEVAELVDGVSKLDKLRFSSNEIAQAESFRKMLLAMARDVRVILVKLADRIHNMRTLGVMRPEKRARIARETLDIYVPIAHRLGLNNVFRELQELSFANRYPFRYKVLYANVLKTRQARREFLEKMMEDTRTALLKAGIPCRILGRDKTIYGIYNKMREKHQSFSDALDIYGFRLVVKNLDDCYLSLGALHRRFKPVHSRFKDFIAIPKSNGYQSLHTTVIGPDGTPVEFQIRTEEMHRIDENGILVHWLYSSSEDTSDLQSRTAAWLQNLLEIQRTSTDSTEFLENIKVDLFPNRIYVFTPKGKVMSLPSGSTPIDFAYAIHSGVGNAMIGAKVNNRIANIDTKLRNGDIVEVLTSKAAKGPSRDWLTICKSNQARTKIKQWFKKEKREENIVHGKASFESEMKRVGLPLTAATDPELEAQLLKKLSFDTWDDMFAAIGYGGLTAAKAVGRIRDDINKALKQQTAEKLPQSPLRFRPDSEAVIQNRHAVNGVIVEDIDSCMIKFAKCCTPVPGDPIVGFITKGFGVSIHRADCPNAQSREDPRQAARWVRVRWATQEEQPFETTLELDCITRDGLILDVAMVLSTARVRVKEMNGKDLPGGRSAITIRFEVKNVAELESVRTKLLNIRDVVGSRRGQN